MDSLLRPWQLTLAAALLGHGGCGFDTAPLPGGASASALAGAAGAPITRGGSAGSAAQTLPSVTTTGTAGGAPTSPVSGAGASTGGSAAQSAPSPGQPAIAGTSGPAPAGPAAIGGTLCDAVGSWGLQVRADLAWDATNGLTDAGRGTAELYALLDVTRVDPQSGAISAEARVCGLQLPVLSSPISCGQYQLRFADKLWEQRELPRIQLGGNFGCAADGCKLQLAPADFILGIRLNAGQPDWPAPGTTMVAQFADDDADGLPGLTADIVSLASTGPGSGSTGNANPGCSYTPFGAAVGLASTSNSDAGRMLLGLRTQLTAALGVGRDCRVTDASGELRSLGLRAGGCELHTTGWTGGMGPMMGSVETTACTEEMRSTLDGSLPSFQVLAAGQAPAPSSTPRDTSLSRGPALRAVRFLPGVTPSCEQVRKAMY